MDKLGNSENEKEVHKEGDSDANPSEDGSVSQPVDSSWIGFESALDNTLLSQPSIDFNSAVDRAPPVYEQNLSFPRGTSVNEAETSHDHISQVDEALNVAARFGSTGSTHIQIDQSKVSPVPPKKPKKKKIEVRIKFDSNECAQPEELHRHDYEGSSSSTAVLNYHDKTIEVKACDIEHIKYINEGHYGFVGKLVIPSHPDVIVAVKKMKDSKDDNKILCLICNEWNIMSKIGCDEYPNLIDYFGTLIPEEKQAPYFFMELMDGTLEEISKTKRAELISMDTFICNVIYYTTLGLESLQNLGYFHRDVKPTNILFNSKEKFKLADYGTCCKISEAGSRNARSLGTYAYFPPELANAILYPTDDSMTAVTIKADMWALGITLIESVVGEHPCCRSVMVELEQLLAIRKWTPTVNSELISPQIKAIVLCLLKIHPDERPASYEEIRAMLPINTLWEERTMK